MGHEFFKCFYCGMFAGAELAIVAFGLVMLAIVYRYETRHLAPLR